MTRDPRIAVVSKAADPLVRDLQVSPWAGEVRGFSDLYRQAAALHAFAPRVLVHCVSQEPEPRLQREFGALRILLEVLPGCRLLLIADPASGSTLAAEAGLDFSHLDPDHEPAALQAQVHGLLQLEAGDQAESYLGFARGICDEINNPLMFASGHLQLLESGLDPAHDTRAIAQVRAIRDGLARIGKTMDKVSNMARAGDLDRQDQSFSLAALLEASREFCNRAQLEVRIEEADNLPALQLQGDRELLARAVLHLAEVGLELRSQSSQPLQIGLRLEEGSLEFLMQIDAARIEEWELPKAFEPYQLHRILSGTSLGLNLFLVQLVARAHRGAAAARRSADGRVAFSVTIGI